ncbi:MAG: guanine deaminase [Gammaproteobacteria bacterium]|nr:guanine deaminase [Gammaproteobacteria bacterium]
MTLRRAFRASILHCLADPGEANASSAIEYFDDGLLVVNNGLVEQLGPAAALLAGLSADVELIECRDKLIIPGLIDCHVHYPQIDMIASYGTQLLDWLERYAYPTECRFSDVQHAAEVAAYFADALLRNGTTTALVFATVHVESADAIFAAAEQRGMRLIAGKVLMDRNCPEQLRDGPDGGIEASRKLIDRWHGKGRLSYAITPRFAITSSNRQLQAAGELAAEFPDVYLQTHLAENAAEIDMVAKLFPKNRSYYDVYDRFGLSRARSVFAHCLNIDDADRQQLQRRGAAIAFCPGSNLFLGSGLFDLRSASNSRIRVGIGSDVGGGSSLNLLRTLSDAYKALQLNGQSLPGFRALYLATLGAAKALYLDDRIGNFASGKEADFIMLDSSSSPAVKRRLSQSTDVAEKFFALMTLGDDRAVAATYLMGRSVFTAGE